MVRLRNQAGLERCDGPGSVAGFWIVHYLSARMIASLKNGMSSGLRDVIRFPSSTTGLSTYMPPAFLTSIAIDGQHVSVLPLTALAEISMDAAWQIAATGLPASFISRVKSTIAWRMRILSGA